MRIAILANILGNLHAFNTVLEDLKKQSVERFIILGNTIGYGPHDQQVLKIIQKLNVIYSLKGNQEKALFSNSILNNLNPYVAQTILKTKKEISSENLVILEHCLEKCLYLKRYYFIPEAEVYPGRILNQHDSIRILLKNYSNYNIISSFHHQVFYATLNENQEINVSFKSPCELPISSSSFLSIGSVGYPGGNSVFAHYAILDTDEGKAWLCESKYDYTKTQRDMLVAGISKILIKQLSPLYNKPFEEEI